MLATRRILVIHREAHMAVLESIPVSLRMTFESYMSVAFLSLGVAPACCFPPFLLQAPGLTGTSSILCKRMASGGDKRKELSRQKMVNDSEDKYYFCSRSAVTLARLPPPPESTIPITDNI